MEDLAHSRIDDISEEGAALRVFGQTGVQVDVSIELPSKPAVAESTRAAWAATATTGTRIAAQAATGQTVTEPLSARTASFDQT